MGTDAAYVLEELSRNRAPADIEATLIRQGTGAQAARDTLDEVLGEQIQSHAKAGNRDLLIGAPLTALGLLAVLYLLSVTFGAHDLPGPQISKLVRGHVAAWLGLAGGLAELLRAYRNLRHGRRLTAVRDAWIDQRLPLASPVPPAEKGTPPGAGITASPARPWARSVTRSATSSPVHPPKASLPPWIVLAGVGGVAVVILLVLVIGLSRRNGEPGNNGTVQGDPNAPDRNEGPAPQGWIVLFLSDDPSIWNTDTQGERFAVPVRRAHSTVRYLRLRRVGTDQKIIVPIRHEQLVRENRPDPAEGYWWNGTAEDAWGGRHLGIAQIPPTLAGQRGPIRVSNHDFFTGSGFGHKIHANDGQYCAWQGREIPRTVFEIAVTCDALAEAERPFLTTPGADEGPAPKGWMVLFRSDDPSLWNTDSPGSFAQPLHRAHSRVRYLRLRRLDTGDSVIVPISRAELGREPKTVPETGVAWNGGLRNEYGGWHLGIIRGPRHRWPDSPRGAISVMNDGHDSYLGWGFGHKIGVDDAQYFSWDGREIPRTSFEIAVSAEDLPESEQQRLLK